VQRIRRKPTQLLRERGCGILVFLLITMPVWVMSISWRGPLFAAGALVVLLVIVFVMATMHRRGD
jgi:hypothetical protein